MNTKLVPTPQNYKNNNNKTQKKKKKPYTPTSILIHLKDLSGKNKVFLKLTLLYSNLIQNLISSDRWKPRTPLKLTSCVHI